MDEVVNHDIVDEVEVEDELLNEYAKPFIQGVILLKFEPDESEYQVEVAVVIVTMIVNDETQYFMGWLMVEVEQQVAP